MINMNMNKTILGLGFVICLIGSGVIILNEWPRSSVKGVSTTISLPLASTPTPTLTPSPTPEAKSVSHQTQTTQKAKQYGGWYWRSDLNQAQVWIGTDSAGKDIWIDDFPTPTPTPTPKTATQHLSTQGTVSTSGTSSMGNMIQTAQIKQ
ncbi:MAG: hypothetical protein A2687_02285 [Candidatus Levybacteria bacterium RIFCSPHIGHO2_01_FULL_38_26]|nr:MAG: hypothetical protein A2687_02285 [Candidatus Levybacteria bacterium RIFCSPHIGHO2_01_FULL_38_26]